MSGRDTVYGVFFYTDEDQIDEEVVKEHFGKYGKIAFVTHLQKKVFINFRTKEEAESCLSDYPDPRFGKIKRGKFGSDESQNSKAINIENGYKRNGAVTYPKKIDKNEKKRNSRKSGSESDEASVKSNFRHSMDGNPYSSTLSLHSVSQPRASDRKSMPYQSKRSSSDGPPPLLSANGPPPLESMDNGPPPLLSIDSGPPPLISTLERNHPSSAKLPLNGSNQRPPLLPTPPMYLRCDFNPELVGSLPSHHISNLSVQNAFAVPPPLVSASSHSAKEIQECAQSSLTYEDYVKKYGNYVLIINIPEDTTTEEMEKVLYPHIPICVSEPEETNIRFRIWFCLVTFNSKSDATKAAKQLDGVEYQGQCLRMIRLDELLLFSDVPF